MTKLVTVIALLTSITAMAEEPGFFEGFRRAGKVLTKDIKKVAQFSNDTLCKKDDKECLLRIEKEKEKKQSEKKSK